MNSPPPFLSRRRLAAPGMTLVELTIGLMVALGVAAASLGLLTQQLSFTRMTRDQAFLLEDCPTINNLLSRILARTDSYRIYEDLAAAQGGGVSALSGKALLLVFRDSLNRQQFAIVAFEADGGDGRSRLGYFNATNGILLNGTPQWANTPDWVLSRSAADVEFSVDAAGVLQVRLTGSQGEQITYSGHTQS